MKFFFVCILIFYFVCILINFNVSSFIFSHRILFSSKLRSNSDEQSAIDKNLNWLIRPEEEIINIDSPPTEEMFFDNLNIGEDKKENTFSFEKMTIADISRSYQFSLAYLGDFIVQLGTRPPIDINAPIETYLMGDQLVKLMEAVYSLDPFDTNIGNYLIIILIFNEIKLIKIISHLIKLEYDSYTLRSLAEELEIPRNRILKICSAENINLPFGIDTILHKSIVERIKNVHECDEYLDNDEVYDSYGVKIHKNNIYNI